MDKPSTITLMTDLEDQETEPPLYWGPKGNPWKALTQEAATPVLQCNLHYPPHRGGIRARPGQPHKMWGK